MTMSFLILAYVKYVFSKKLENYHIAQKFLLVISNKYSNRKSYANVHSSNIYNGQKVEITPEVHQQMDRQVNIVYTFNGY